MESWQDEIIKAQISQEIGVEMSMENSDISVFLKSFKENLLSAVDRDSFDKSWSSDLQKRFPNGSWKTVNGARVFINNGKVIAGLDGFNGEIDKFFAERNGGGKEKKGDLKSMQDKLEKLKEEVANLSKEMDPKTHVRPEKYYKKLREFQATREKVNSLLDEKKKERESSEEYKKEQELAKQQRERELKRKQRENEVTSATHEKWERRVKRDIDSRFEGRGSGNVSTKESKQGEEEKFSDLQDKIDHYKDLSPAEREKYRSETVDFIMDLKGRLSKTKDDKVKEVYEKQIRFSDKLLSELQKIKRKPVSDMTDDEFLELKNPYGSKWKDLFDNYSNQVKDAVKNKKFPSVEDAVKEVRKMEKTEREFGSEEKARLLRMVADKFSKQEEGGTDNSSENKGNSIPKSKDGLYQIYLHPIKNKDGNVEYLYGVPSIKNKESKGAGDGLHDNLKDAIEEAEFNRNKELLQKKQEDDRLAEEKKSQEEERKRKEANKGKTKLEIMNEARAQKVLNSKVSINGTIKTKKEHVQDVIRNGGKVGTAEVNKYKGVSRSRYNRMDGREQEELERKIKEGGKKTEYRLYTKDGSFYDISKIEYDYANQISNK